jgi:hypothetical protein
VAPWIGSVEPLDDLRSVLVTRAKRVEDLPAHLGMLGPDFRISEPPELVDALSVLANMKRPGRGTRPGLLC